MKNQFTKFEASFIEQLSSIGIADISNEKIVTDYLQNILQHKKYFVKIYSFLLAEAVKKLNKPLQNITVLDYGTGNGLLALFAKYCGFKKVFACDYDENFIVASTRLSNTLNIYINDWSVSNEYDVKNHYQDKNIDIIVGTDVIEHIYNLDIFFSNIHALNPNIITAFTTASVYDNYFKRKKLEALMLKDEVEYLEQRKKIIHNYDNSLAQNEIENLATVTRGLKESDMYTYTEEYRKTGVMNSIKINNTNTCDPYTGNFTERILTIREYNKLYEQHQFSISFISGFYDDDKNLLQNLIIKILNFFINCINNKYLSRTIAPFIILVGNSTNKSHVN